MQVWTWGDYTADLLSAKCRALIFPLQRGAERLASRDSVCEGGEEETIGHAPRRTTCDSFSFASSSASVDWVDLLSIPACRRSELISPVRYL